MEPKTNTISVRGGIKINPTLNQNAASIFPLYGTEGAKRGKNKAKIRIKTIYNKTKTMPGTKAPKNISPALVEVTSMTDGIERSPVASLYKDFLIELA